MKKTLKNACLISIGLFFGFIFSTFASNQSITVVKDNITSIFIKGEKINISKENTPINYKNKLYVPLRLISEKVGLSVDYDKKTKTVYISESSMSEELKQEQYKQLYNKIKEDFEKEKAQIIEEAIKNTKEEIKKYQKLPISYKKDEFSMNLNLAVKKNNNGNSEFYFSVKNQQDYAITVDPFSAKFEYLDDKKYERISTSENVNVNNMSTKILSSIDPNFDDKIFFTLEQIPEYVKSGTLSFNIYPVSDKSNITKVVIPMSLD